MVLGLELRDSVAEFVRKRIGRKDASTTVAIFGLEYLREESGGGKYGNAACIRLNAMKHLPHYFRPGQLEKMFFLFPVRFAA